MRIDYDILTKAKSEIVLDEPFYSTLLLSMPLTEDNRQPTMYVDGTKIGYNRKFTEGLTVKQCVGCLCHEVMHIALMHPFRMEDRDPQLWNIAGDFVINWSLKEAKFELPEGALIDEQFKDMSTEEVYRKIRKNAEKYKAMAGQQQLEGDLRPSPGDACDKAAAEANARVEVTRAMAVGKQQGALPGALKDQLVLSQSEKSHWREQLREFMTEPLKDDQSWNRGQRRFMYTGLYLPAMHSLGLGEVAVIMDSSGSVYNEAPLFFKEFNSIADDCKPKSITLIQVDAAVQDVKTYEPGEPLIPTVHGGGGTDMCEGFDYIADPKNNLNPAICIVLTDLYTPFPTTPPDYPVLWVSVCREHVAPFGETIYI